MKLATYVRTPSRKILTICLVAIGYVSPLLLVDLGTKGAYLDIPAFNFVVLNSLLLASLFKKFGNIEFSESLQALGIPLGLIGSYIGVILAVGNVSVESDFTASLAVMVLTSLYGGMVSIFGYALSGKDSDTEQKKLKIHHIIISILLFSGLLILAIGIDQIEAFFDKNVFIIFAIFIVTFIVLDNGKKHFTLSVMNACLFASVIAATMSLLSWYDVSINRIDEIEIFRKPMLFATKAVMYGSLFYMLAYIVSLGCEIENRVKVGLMNWHLIEINTFVLFLTLAPSSYSDFIEKQKQIQENESVIEGLIERIEELESKL